jgi:hypothetical protein
VKDPSMRQRVAALGVFHFDSEWFSIGLIALRIIIFIKGHFLIELSCCF